jgi:hypothetical protein
MYKISQWISLGGGVICIFAGLNLSLLRTQSRDSVFQAIANGIGIYCIGKGAFLVGFTMQDRYKH